MTVKNIDESNTRCDAEEKEQQERNGEERLRGEPF
jgi:hypothetical protein